MYVMTREKNEGDTIKTLHITSPKFDIDEIRRIKAFIRFKTKCIVVKKAEDSMEMHDLNTIFKYGRCISIRTIDHALHGLTVRVSGKEKDSVYDFSVVYNNGSIFLTVENAYSIND